MPANQHHSLLVIGSSNWDICMYLPRLPQAGETVAGGQLKNHLGGKGANQAVAAARSGASVGFITCIGDDPVGADVRSQLIAEGLPDSHIISVKNCATGTACIFIDEAGENCIGLTAGANGELNAARLDAFVPAITAARWLLLQLEIPLATIWHIVELARQQGASVVLNPAPAVVLEDELLACVDILTPNETELALLSGVEATDEASLAQAAEIMLDKGVGALVVTLGSRGAVHCYRDSNGQLQLDAVSAYDVDAVDTTAAGDVFNGVLCAGLAAGEAMAVAMKRATAAAALSVTRAGAIPSIPQAKDIDTLLAEQPAA